MFATGRNCAGITGLFVLGDSAGFHEGSSRHKAAQADLLLAGSIGNFFLFLLGIVGGNSLPHNRRQFAPSEGLLFHVEIVTTFLSFFVVKYGL